MLQFTMDVLIPRYIIPTSNRAFDRDIQAYREINWISWLAILKRDLMKLDRHTIILYKVSQKLYKCLLRITFIEVKIRNIIN